MEFSGPCTSFLSNYDPQPTNEGGLKCNRLLDQLVQSFTTNRKDLMALTQLNAVKSLKIKENTVNTSDKSVGNVRDQGTSSHSPPARGKRSNLEGSCQRSSKKANSCRGKRSLSESCDWCPCIRGFNLL